MRIAKRLHNGLNLIDTMETYDFKTPILTRKGLKIDKATVPIIEPIPFDRTTSKDYAKSKSKNTFKAKSMEDRVINKISTVSSGLFSSEAVFSIEFEDGGTTTLKPINCPYVDADIYFEKINARYRPKTYSGMKEGYPSSFEEFAMKILQKENYFEGLKIRSFKMYLEDDLSDVSNAFSEKIYAISMKGELNFRYKDRFAYDHVEDITINLYPDIIHQLVEVGPGVRDKDFHLKKET